VGTRLEGEVRLGIVGATQARVAQIQKWSNDFRKGSAIAEATPPSDTTRFDLCLIVAEAAQVDGTDLAEVILQAGRTPCLVLSTSDSDEESDALVELALAGGAVDFLPWTTLDAVRLEYAVRFGIRRRQVQQLRALRETCVDAERERDLLRLANALHDGPMQDLIGTRFLLAAMSSDEVSSTIQNNLQSVIQDLRSICSELKPPALGPFGLEKAIRAHMQMFQVKHPDLQITLELDADQQKLPEWVRVALFRVYQALLANVHQHAQATSMWVRLRFDEQQVRLTVADDGQGFDIPNSWLEFARQDRCGLLMIQVRMDALRGRMMVQSTPGGGARVMIQAPLRQPTAPLLDLETLAPAA
jgi:signal transduction histidine kinase